MLQADAAADRAVLPLPGVQGHRHVVCHSEGSARAVGHHLAAQASQPPEAHLGRAAGQVRGEPTAFPPACQGAGPAADAQHVQCALATRPRQWMPHPTCVCLPPVCRPAGCPIVPTAKCPASACAAPRAARRRPRRPRALRGAPPTSAARCTADGRGAAAWARVRACRWAALAALLQAWRASRERDRAVAASAA